MVWIFFAYPLKTAAYAVLSHEAVIDTAWETNIRPLLLKRFPDATPEQLKEAHGYAYGGSIIQDMGYYPHGSFFFSDLTHYATEISFRRCCAMRRIWTAMHSRSARYPTMHPTMMVTASA